jgi:hypothetical protein
MQERGPRREIPDRRVGKVNVTPSDFELAIFVAQPLKLQPKLSAGALRHVSADPGQDSLRGAFQHTADRVSLRGADDPADSLAHPPDEISQDAIEFRVACHFQQLTGEFQPLRFAERFAGRPGRPFFALPEELLCLEWTMLRPPGFAHPFDAIEVAHRILLVSAWGHKGATGKSVLIIRS